ncbi:ROK family protein [Brachybacterium hainanense]|uniref:ROK family protein n=1 Tax=Brachybacterium hainanense TaxID=1541174 RepID=A0ABV6RDX2_9MICO
MSPGGEPCSCGSRGCWERYSSGSALRRAARDRGFGREDTSHRVLATHADDPVARDLLDTVAAHFVDGLEVVSAVLDPSTVVLGGGLGTDPAFFDAVHTRYARQAITPPRSRPQLTRGRLGNLAGAVGAADLAAPGRT